MFSAIRVSSFGGPEVLELVEIAETFKPAADQVVVEIHACSVNPVETYIRTGTHTVRPSLPYTPGNDGAGVVIDVGENVIHFKAGDRVYVSKSITGTYAQQCLCYQQYVHPLSEGLNFYQGAAIGTAYLTAYRALIQRSQARPNERVLVHGASGGVGIAAVQLCRMYGMKTFGTASTEKGRQLIRDQGQDIAAFDHSTEDYLEKVLAETSGRGVDVILEMLADVNLSKDLTVLAKNGRVAVIGNRGTTAINARETMNRESDIRGVYLPLASEHDLQEAHAALKAGFDSQLLKPVVGCVLPLSRAAEAHEKVMQSGAYGKIILEC